MASIRKRGKGSRRRQLLVHATAWPGNARSEPSISTATTSEVSPAPTWHCSKLFAVTSAYALHSSQRLDIARKHAMDLERALESRGVIEQAKGIIMGTHHVDADRAFRILIQDSQRSNVKLRVIAQQYIDGAIDPRQATNKPETN